MIIIAGPCQIESRDHCLMMADLIKDTAEALKTEIIFKSSFDKANRTSGKSPRGVGLVEGGAILAEVKRRFGLRTLTDVHETWQCEALRGAVDILQIPAFLCRQTDLIHAASACAETVNVKKGQFMDPRHMAGTVEKARHAGARVWLTERGTSFGHGDLVVDMRSFRWMRSAKPDAIIFDATHSAQLPTANGNSSGGDRRVIPTLAAAAIAAGADGIFVETHDDPANAPSDGDVMWPVGQLYDFLARLIDLHEHVSGMNA